MKALLFTFAVSAVFNLCICHQKVQLSSVSAITLKVGKFTTARRGTPIPQLRCVPSVLPCNLQPSTVQCYNKGTDGLDIQWRCEAQLPKSVQFDNIQVSCEGYDYPADPYILIGSCGLTYSLKPTGLHQKSHYHHQHNAHFVVHRVQKTHMVPIVSGILLIVVLVGLALIAYRICPCHPSAPVSEVGGPPSYYSRTQYRPLDACEDSKPGFWTGAAVGGAAGYLIGSGTAAAAVAPPCYQTVTDVTYTTSDCSDEDELVTAAGFASTWRR